MEAFLPGIIFFIATKLINKLLRAIGLNAKISLNPIRTAGFATMSGVQTFARMTGVEPLKPQVGQKMKNVAKTVGKAGAIAATGGAALATGAAALGSAGAAAGKLSGSAAVSRLASMTDGAGKVGKVLGAVKKGQYFKAVSSAGDLGKWMAARRAEQEKAKAAEEAGKPLPPQPAPPAPSERVVDGANVNRAPIAEGHSRTIPTLDPSVGRKYEQKRGKYEEAGKDDRDLSARQVQNLLQSLDRIRSGSAGDFSVHDPEKGRELTRAGDRYVVKGDPHHPISMVPANYLAEFEHSAEAMAEAAAIHLLAANKMAFDEKGKLVVTDGPENHFTTETLVHVRAGGDLRPSDVEAIPAARVNAAVRDAVDAAFDDIKRHYPSPSATGGDINVQLSQVDRSIVNDINVGDAPGAIRGRGGRHLRGTVDAGDEGGLGGGRHMPDFRG